MTLHKLFVFVGLFSFIWSSRSIVLRSCVPCLYLLHADTRFYGKFFRAFSFFDFLVYALCYFSFYCFFFYVWPRSSDLFFKDIYIPKFDSLIGLGIWRGSLNFKPLLEHTLVSFKVTYKKRFSIFNTIAFYS